MFNALKYTQEMEQAGFSRQQAEVSMKILIDVMNENFATKSDLFETESRLKTEIFAVKSDLTETETRLGSQIKALDLKVDTAINRFESKLEASMRELDYKLTIKLGMMLTASIGITAALFKLLNA